MLSWLFYIIVIFEQHIMIKIFAFSCDGIFAGFLYISVSSIHDMPRYEEEYHINGGENCYS